MDEKNELIFYSNSIMARMNQFDLSLKFQLNSDNMVVDQATVLLSWNHAKILLKLLQEHINNYEDLYSEILIEPNPEKFKTLIKEGKIVEIKE